MSTFNYFKDTDIFKIAVKVENSKNDKNLDIIEFGINDPPKTKDLIITSSEPNNNYTMKSYFNITTLNLTLTTS